MLLLVSFFVSLGSLVLMGALVPIIRAEKDRYSLIVHLVLLFYFGMALLLALRGFHWTG